MYVVQGKYYDVGLYNFEAGIPSTIAKVQNEVLELSSRIRVEIKNIGR